MIVGSLLELLAKRRSHTFPKPIDVHAVIDVAGECIYSVEYCESVR